MMMIHYFLVLYILIDNKEDYNTIEKDYNINDESSILSVEKSNIRDDALSILTNFLELMFKMINKELSKNWIKFEQ
jgi:hypothetical protein